MNLRVASTSLDRRGVARRPLKLASTLTDAPDLSVTVHDLSAVGFLVETSADLRLNDDFELDLPEAHGTQARVIWNDGRMFGCEFKRPLPLAGLSAAALRSEVLPRSPSSIGEIRLSNVSEASLLVGSDLAELATATKFWMIFALALASWAVVGLVIAGAMAMIG